MNTVFNQSLYTITFLPPGPKAPVTLLAEGVLRFKGGMLDGWELRGFSVWDNGPDKHVSVSMPSRSYFTGNVKKNWDLLRRPDSADADESKSHLAQLQSVIRVSYAQWVAKTPPPLKAQPKVTTTQAFSQATLASTPKVVAVDIETPGAAAALGILPIEDL